MIVTFTRTGERTYSTLAKREDSVLVHVPSYDRPTALPHDIAHFIIERGLHLSSGFWGCVASGAMFPGMRIVSGRNPLHAEERSRQVIKRAGDLLTEAETLVAVMLHITSEKMENDWPRVSKYLRLGWQPRHASRGPLGREEVKQVCLALREAEEWWGALPIGEEMVLAWGAQPNKRFNRTRDQGASHSQKLMRAG